MVNVNKRIKSFVSNLPGKVRPFWKFGFDSGGLTPFCDQPATPTINKRFDPLALTRWRFGSVTTKPDFAKVDELSVPLFVDFKYVKNRPRLNSVVTEMTSRVTVYGTHGAWIRFIIYDPERTITDDDKFVRAFEQHEKVWIGISR